MYDKSPCGRVMHGTEEPSNFLTVSLQFSTNMKCRMLPPKVFVVLYVECAHIQLNRYFLDAGSLLGAVRDGDMIKCDHDIDLGILPVPNLESRMHDVMADVRIFKFLPMKVISSPYFSDQS